MMLSNQEKINVIIDRINQLEIHISLLSQDLFNNPDLDVAGKPLRQDVLQEYINRKQLLEGILETLTNQG